MSRTAAFAAIVPKVAIWLTRVAAVLVAHVLDDAVAPFLAEVDVEVGHRHAFRIQETLEQQVVAQRIEVGHAERYATSEPAPEPRPGPTGTPLFFAQLMKSATIRK